MDCVCISKSGSAASTSPLAFSLAASARASATLSGCSSFSRCDRSDNRRSTVSADDASWLRRSLRLRSSCALSLPPRVGWAVMIRRSICCCAGSVAAAAACAACAINGRTPAFRCKGCAPAPGLDANTAAIASSRTISSARLMRDATATSMIDFPCCSVEAGHCSSGEIVYSHALTGKTVSVLANDICRRQFEKTSRQGCIVAQAPRCIGTQGRDLDSCARPITADEKKRTSIACPFFIEGCGLMRQPCSPDYRPAAAFSAAALSVRSQLNSGSSRPKWP